MPEPDIEEGYKRYESIRQLLPIVRNSRVWLRAPQRLHPKIQAEVDRFERVTVTHRDAAFCALGNKASNTHSAIQFLVDSGYADEALALVRTLLENAVLMKWLLRDPVYRIDAYCLSAALFKRGWQQNVNWHYADRPALVADAERALDDTAKSAADYFGKRRTDWLVSLDEDGDAAAVRIKQMFEELVESESGDETRSFLYDSVYFDLSAYVHSAAPSVSTLAKPLKRATFFDLELARSTKRSALAISIANMAMLMALDAIADYTGLEALSEAVRNLIEEERSRTQRAGVSKA